MLEINTDYSSLSSISRVHSESVQIGKHLNDAVESDDDYRSLSGGNCKNKPSREGKNDSDGEDR